MVEILCELEGDVCIRCFESIKGWARSLCEQCSMCCLGNFEQSRFDCGSSRQCKVRMRGVCDRIFESIALILFEMVDTSR